MAGRADPQMDPAGRDAAPAQHQADGASCPADFAAGAPLCRLWGIKGLHRGLESLFL